MKHKTITIISCKDGFSASGVKPKPTKERRAKESEGKNKTQKTITIKIVFFVRSKWDPIRVSGCRLRVRAQQAQPLQIVEEEEERCDVSADV